MLARGSDNRFRGLRPGAMASERAFGALRPPGDAYQGSQVEHRPVPLADVRARGDPIDEGPEIAVHGRRAVRRQPEVPAIDPCGDPVDRGDASPERDRQGGARRIGTNARKSLKLFQRVGHAASAIHLPRERSQAGRPPDETERTDDGRDRRFASAGELGRIRPAREDISIDLRHGDSTRPLQQDFGDQDLEGVGLASPRESPAVPPTPGHQQPTEGNDRDRVHALKDVRGEAYDAILPTDGGSHACTDAHWIDGDPCINCSSTHTEGSDDLGSTTVRCLDCGEVFDVEAREYKLFAEGRG